MTDLVKVEKRKVLEPTEVIPPGWANFGGGSRMQEPFIYREWHPNVFMRRLGYTANPDICRHSRKAYQPRFGWWCRDCGDSLRQG